jgi:hypothetical protein
MRGASAALRLCVRRTAFVAVSVPLLAVLLVATRADVGDDFAFASAVGRSAAGANAATFTSVFATCVSLAAFTLVPYARHLARVRGSESAGLLVAPVGRTAWTLGNFGGVLLALCGALVCTCAVLLACGLSIDARHELRGTLDVPPLALLGERDARAIVVAPQELSGASHVALRLVALPDAGMVVFVSLSAQRLAADGATPVGETLRSETRVWSHARLVVELPPGDGAVVLRLARLGRGAGVGIERNGVLALAPTHTPFAAELRLLACAFVALASAAALCTGIVPHTSPFFATALALLPFAVAFALGDAPAWLPGAEFFTGREAATLGVAGPWPSLATGAIIGAAALLVAARAPRFARQNDWS